MLTFEMITHMMMMNASCKLHFNQAVGIHKNLSDLEWMIWEAFGLPYHPFVHLSHVNCNFRTIPLSFSFATMIPPDLKSFGPSSFAEPTK